MNSNNHLRAAAFIVMVSIVYICYALYHLK